MSLEYLHSLALELLAETARNFPTKLQPTITWHNFRVTAGRAVYHTGEIQLSRVLITDEDRLRLTLLHEYAHLLAFDRFGKRGMGHGAAWKQAMIDLGQEPAIHHTYEVVRNQRRKKVVYQCARCGAHIETARTLKTGAFRVYLHVNCGGRIRKIGVRSLELRTSDATPPNTQP